MQISNNYSIVQNNTSPNFKAIRSLEFAGKLKKQPRLQEQLLDALENNKTIMDFCKKYDTKIQFNQFRADNYVVSKLYVAYEGINDTKKTLWEKIKSLFKSPRMVVVDGFSNMAYDEKSSVKILTEKMAERTYLFENAEKQMTESAKSASLKKAKSSEIDTSHISNGIEYDLQSSVNERIKNLTNK
jgi:hypothetical protein